MSELHLEEGNKRDPTKDFDLIEKLGEGSYGSVWKAVHHKTNTVTAIKRVPVENDLEEILNEIKIMKQCKSPYIINYYGSYFKESELWIVMEYCGGGSVADLMKVLDRTLTEEQIAAVLRDALRGLAYLHSIRKIHRDIKAGNILLNNKGEGKLADFGVSGQLSDTMAKRQTVIGTPFWMAPEVIQEVGYGVEADLWSLGITGIELAEGHPPYSNIHPMRAIFLIPSKPPPKLTEPEKWTRDFNDFIAKCLTKKPDERPSAEELLKHPYILNAKGSAVILPLVEEANEIIARDGREVAMGFDQSDSEEEGTSSPAANGSTTVRASSTDEQYSTMVISKDDDGSGTMRVGGAKDDYVAPFLAHIKHQEEAKEKSKYATFSVEELKNMLAQMDSKLDKEIEAIKAKYAQQKKELEQVIQNKKKSH